MNILTYSSSVRIPQTIYTKHTLLQNTQTRLSYQHVHFTNTMEISADCDILVIDGREVQEEFLDSIQKIYNGTIIWSKDVVGTLLWFVETFDREQWKSYTIVDAGDDIRVDERDTKRVNTNVCTNENLHVQSGIGGKMSGQDYINRKFYEVEQERNPIERLFSKLSIIKGDAPGQGRDDMQK